MLGTKFFERKEVKDVLSYLRLALNPESTGDYARIVNEPARGIGKSTVLKILEGKRAELAKGALTRVAVFDDLMAEIRDTTKRSCISDTLKLIAKRSGMEEAMRKDGEEGLERLENIRELVSLSIRYDEYEPLVAAERLLEDAALQSDQDELADTRSAVRLMTVHASKGLEFEHVFVGGMEEGLFPHERLDTEAIDEEEERRLFYVALTRAKKQAHLSFSSMRTIFGSKRINMPSSFLRDIGDDLMVSANPTESGYEKTIEID
jgi:DNA helicase-2/ATP-dependent DNA helicase PcrA